LTKFLDELLKSFDIPEVSELVLVSDTRPAARAGVSLDPIMETKLSGDDILTLLMALGGSRYVEELGPSPKQWTSRVMGFGVIGLSALQRGQEIQAKITVSKRDAKAATPAVASTPNVSPSPQVVPASQAQSAPQKLPSSPRAALSREDFDEPPKLPTRPGLAPADPPKAAPARDVRPIAVPPPSSRSVQSAAPALSASPTPMPMPAQVAPPPRRDVAPVAPPPPAPTGFGSGDSSPRAMAKTELATPVATPAAVEKAKIGPPPVSAASALAHGAPSSVVASISPPPPDGGAMFDSILFEARRQLASDLLIIAGRPVLFRIGGELRPIGDVLPPALVEANVRPLIPPRLKAQLREDGSCDFAYDSPKHGRFRVNVARHQGGLMAVFRLISRELPSIESLGLPPAIATVTNHHQGLVVFTGPTGHGKTTTMTAVVDLLNRSTTHHIITVEDPVEHLHPKKRALISQREVGTHTRSFGSALKGSLREDPDVIVVGELRDVETVRMAVAASETGHLVLGTMNTPSASKTIDRLIDLFPPADQPQVRLTLAAGLRLIVSQRLVPSPDRARVHAAVELLPSSPPLSALIRDGKTFQIPSLQQRGKALGIVRLDESLADLVRTRRIAVEDARLVAEAPNELDALIRGGA
jgi:twitching motility protein PilT